ncbi:hypothetical protein [Aequorivita echinoideorum]|uniref:Uncharacterized protein n=1 Tax=Aequorivita echinoideorum TaxID=1549647 RepID=A0ABS5S6F8_9FLAO|nr:hypothetical protein [Aequorivita echinoideorum]MBT0608786.1 hypothetical protein [Aequorivita echinoideorum]
MKQFLALIFAAFLVQSCDDGDIIVTSFDFSDENLEICGEVGNYVFFKINDDLQESISLKLGATDSIFNTQDEIQIFNLDGATNFVNYRTYNATIANDYFCSSVPPTSPGILTDYRSISGSVEITVTFEYDDNDGIPAEFEMPETLDTDGDGIPNYYDFDDDGDNVPTAFELNNEDDTDDDPNTNPLDTDADGTPDYLDMDDDGDEVLTINEEPISADLNPRNDIENGSEIPNYLREDRSGSVDTTQYIEHTYTVRKTIRVTLKNLVLVNGEESLTIETLELGTIENIAFPDVNITPTF